MEFDEYQQGARRTLNTALDPANRLMDAAAGLAEEAGEVPGLVRKQVYQHRVIARENVIEELGDVLWCLAITADTLGISFEEFAEENRQKLARRHPDGYSG
jgi:NTP pyrophosphatase (non-canonical NTP hydrolase)